ncbi:hypothetical protein phiAS5_ORF0175 [Aeromonas phage phiAS5]|uniref:Uncharacterized protein n=1 Tax=Aeromonas phage phiAS5 TaxID=879630 RepID=E1A2S2_9CAUD|nr:hypothetical protein phiAS5_ORF0175 [Aeromonas phage phiAS5]ADM80018.1 hypothetical protein phiAS5_ORF0175 [Aeromonas phage phiAS5]
MNIDLFNRIQSYREFKGVYDQMRLTLQKVLQGEITREECKKGLCDLIATNEFGVDLATPKVLEGYKHWSGKVGYIIYVGEIDREALKQDRHMYLSRAVAQYENEQYVGDNDEYWEARLELARHWIRYIDETKKLSEM